MWHRRIRQFRLTHGLRQSELAARLGVTQATISRWESGDQDPDARYRHALRDLLREGRLSFDERLFLSVRRSPHLAAIINESHRFIAISASYDRLFGRQEGDGLDERHLSPGTLKALRDVDPGFWDGSIVNARLETGFIHQDGRCMGVELSLTPVALTTGELVVVIQISVQTDLPAGDIRLDPERIPTLDLLYFDDF